MNYTHAVEGSNPSCHNSIGGVDVEAGAPINRKRRRLEQLRISSSGILDGTEEQIEEILVDSLEVIMPRGDEQILTHWWKLVRANGTRTIVVGTLETFAQWQDDGRSDWSGTEKRRI